MIRIPSMDVVMMFMPFCLSDSISQSTLFERKKHEETIDHIFSSFRVVSFVESKKLNVKNLYVV
jgi:hypothetical protein